MVSLAFSPALAFIKATGEDGVGKQIWKRVVSTLLGHSGLPSSLPSLLFVSYAMLSEGRYTQASARGPLSFTAYVHSNCFSFGSSNVQAFLFSILASTSFNSHPPFLSL